MTIREVSTKIDIRLNKSASGDYDNLWPYIKKEAFNKAINEWVRRQVHGKNQTQEGDEETTMRVDDLQVLLKPDTLTSRKKGLFNESEKLPSDYLYHKRLTPVVSKGRCRNLTIKSHLREEVNVDDLRSFPSFEFEETFHTLIGNRFHVHHNNDFEINKLDIVYYRKPKVYQFKNLDELVEFKDDICEMLVDDACAIIASDIESLNAKAINEQRSEKNN